MSKSNQVRQYCKVKYHIFSELCCFCQVYSVFKDLQELIFSLSSVLWSNVTQVFGDMYLTVLWSCGRRLVMVNFCKSTCVNWWEGHWFHCEVSEGKKKKVWHTMLGSLHMSVVCGQPLGSVEDGEEFVDGWPWNAVLIFSDLSGTVVWQLCPASGTGAAAETESNPFSGLLFPYTEQKGRLFFP